MKIEHVKVDILKEAPYNPRIHPEEAIVQLQKSIEAFGFVNPIIAQNSTNMVIAGHARLKAARNAGVEKVPVIFVDMDDVTAKAYNIQDNRSTELTEWDFPKLKDLIADIDTGAIDIELTGFTQLRINDFFNYEKPINPMDEWVGMPEFTQDSKKAFKSIIIHFKTPEALEKFKKIVDSPITDKTKFIWYPYEEKADLSKERYE